MLGGRLAHEHGPQFTRKIHRTGDANQGVLAGGCAQLPGLNEYLASNWGIPVELARPFERIDVAPAYADEAAGMAPALAVAVGLGLRRSGDKEPSK